MGKSKTKRFFAALFLFALIVFFSLASFATVAKAEIGNVYDKTAIEEDLKDFDLSGYQKDVRAVPSLVTFSEYCFSSSESVRENYGLYFYIYNPTEKPLSTETDKNEINMATEYNNSGEPRIYSNCGMTFLDCTENYRFYKFKLTRRTAAHEMARAYASAHDGVRRYDFVGVQLWHEGATGAKDYPINASYRCSGYGAGCDVFGSAESTLTYESSKLETISLDVQQTYYRTDGINQNGAGHHNQLSSVYFSIPKKSLETYGNLYAVKCSWNEARTAPMIVTNDREVYDWTEKWLGKKTGITDQFGIYDNLTKTIGQGARTADWGWGYQYAEQEKDNPQVGGVTVSSDLAPAYVFKSNAKNILDANVSPKEVAEWIEDHGNASYLFTDDVDEGRRYGHQAHTFTADEAFDMLSFNSTANGYDKFLLDWQEVWTGKKWDWGTDFTDVEPIKAVSDDDLKSSNAIIAENLFVNQNDIGEFKDYYNAHKSTDEVFLLRFAVTDYYSNTQTVVTGASLWNPATWGSGTFDDDSTYMARETVFRQFDIIELTFQNEGEETVIGVVSSPVDIVGGIDAPKYDDVVQSWWDKFVEWLLSFLAKIPWWVWLIVAVVVLILLCAIVKPIYRAVIFILKKILWIIARPFRLLGALFEAIAKKREKKKIKKSEEIHEEKDSKDGADKSVRKK